MAKEAADAVVTSGAIEASGTGAIVDIFRTIGSGPSVNANARESAVSVGACRAVFTNARPQSTFVDVLVAVRAGKRRWTLARVRIDAIDTSCAILTQVTRTIVYIFLTICPGET